MRKQYILLVVLFSFFALNMNAQSAKKYYKTGLAFAKSGNYKDAFATFTKSLELDPNYIKAYVARADVSKTTENYREAIKDYERAASLDFKEKKYYLWTAEMYFKVESYDTALLNADHAIVLDAKYLEAHKVKTQSLIQLGRTGEAEKVALKALDLDKDYDTYLNLGTIYFIQKRYADAEKNFRSANKEDVSKVEPLLELTRVCYVQERYSEAINIVYQVFSIDSKNKDGLWLRAKSYEKTMLYQNAIEDLSQIIVYYPKEDYIYDVYIKRGQVYSEFSQNMNAVNDYSVAIEMQPDNAKAYYLRAQAYEATHARENAVKDYKKVAAINPTYIEAAAMLATTNKRLYDLQREEDEPEVFISSPVIRNPGEMEVIKGSLSLVIKGYVKDASEIKSIKINDKKVDSELKSNKYLFDVELAIYGLSTISVEVTDVYDNVLRNDYKVIFTEVDKPEIALVTPAESDDGQIYLDSDKPIIYIEGTIIDASKIVNIMIDSVNASYSPSALNPTFTANISIANKAKIWIEATDIYGNTKRKEYLLNRTGTALAQDNPMGKTWVIFIENSQYNTFATLDGPTKDIVMMKSALSNYRVHKTIHRKNMTKSDMERFFSIELRDLIRKNHVNSIVVWYAGHGKFINNSGYWIPVDAKRDDEFTYFNINTLKSSLQSYSSTITHTLVITDACESGPSFYQAMRSEMKSPDCGDYKATKFKSSQVFSSAGNELASDNSQFTKTFASSLVHNPNSCIPIESIVKKVTSAVVRKKQQKPQFGIIDGMEDENGTFFFMKK